MTNTLIFREVGNHGTFEFHSDTYDQVMTLTRADLYQRVMAIYDGCGPARVSKLRKADLAAIVADSVDHQFRG